MKRVLTYITVLPLLAFASLASALTCDEITLGSAITGPYPDAQEACLEVVERDGRNYVKMEVELTRPGAPNRLTFKFKHADGSFGPTHTINPPLDWRARIGGRNYRARELGSGQELTVYLPPDRWEAHIASSEMDVETFNFIVITPAEPEPQQRMLPATASNMPLFALFGALALFGAATLRIARGRAS